MLRVLKCYGKKELAHVFVAQTKDQSIIEFAEAIQPPIPREQKWVLIVSSLKGCPYKCRICDAHYYYHGLLSAEEIKAQIRYLISRENCPTLKNLNKLKIQFARMGEPALNPAVLSVLRELPQLFPYHALMPCISTIAPFGSNDFFAELLKIKNRYYSGGHMQLQFSLHATDEIARQQIIPARVLSFADIASYGKHYFKVGDRKITLNFAPLRTISLEPDNLLRYFSPDIFLIKLTPVNPSRAVQEQNLDGLIDPYDLPSAEKIANQFRQKGFQTIISIGEPEENNIGSNCGLLAGHHTSSLTRQYDRRRNNITPNNNNKAIGNRF